ncbi:tumor protein D52-like [Oscarella lobularis]|uniref:tumor protein D52-like n=1 Tax=Oscarella lobularis TaxID=121494 RepID=UPI00331318D3
MATESEKEPATLYTSLEQGSESTEDTREEELNTSESKTSNDSEEERHRELEKRMIQVQEEINSLQIALGRKNRELAEIKKQLGITALSQLKEDVKVGFREIKESKPVQSTGKFFRDLGEKITSSGAYQSAASALSTAGEKTGKALKVAGAKTSDAFGRAKTSIKEKIGKSGSEESGVAAVSKSTADAEAKYDSEAALEQ